MIRLQQVSLRRGAKVVLDSVDLTLHPGEKAALVGRNGVGKSSLLRAIMGLQRARRGSVAIRSRSVARRAEEMRAVQDLAAPVKKLAAMLAQEGEDAPTFDTIGGLIAHEMGHVPRRGESFVFAGLQFVVLHTRAGAVRWFKVSRVEAVRPAA